MYFSNEKLNFSTVMEDYTSYLGSYDVLPIIMEPGLGILQLRIILLKEHWVERGH